MRIDVLVPDIAPGASAPAPPDAGAFGALLDAAGAVFARADRAETAFAAHRGGLQEMVVERARADIALQIAATAAQRTAQALQSVFGMQL
jgi:flagellar hook-basal body complex protein FliE